MDPITMAAVMGGMGLLQGKMQADQQQRQNRMQAEQAAAQTRYSPWTGFGAGQSQPQVVSPTASMVGGAAQGAVGGYLQGQQFEKSDLANQKTQEQINAIKKQNMYGQQPASRYSSWDMMNS